MYSRGGVVVYVMFVFALDVVSLFLLLHWLVIDEHTAAYQVMINDKFQ